MSLSFEDLIESHMSSLDTDTINSFQKVFSEAMDCEFSKIEQAQAAHDNMKFLSKEHEHMHRSWIEDDAIYKFSVVDLAGELYILALYKRVELKHKELVRFFNLEVGTRNLSNWNDLWKVLPPEAKKLPEFNAVNELRLLNNAIKHEGVISKQLAKNYPHHGQIGDELTDLSISFERLEPIACKYIKALYAILKSKT
ncbi:hypothetical protein DLH88_24550 [Vibrio parahaemolyticus]|nr:hypothetical protein [Vibrio parahaemolyticus]EGR3154962.1 hypothetical protein [Vibrio parahaemolyticus]EIE1212898.1 hypothetical protein [Vibrio parahaemolyticus]EJC7076574.1 hypothetical protein [Vibrio parahaemolyticus]EKN4540317.1 hypothetical protein [Vibrio parahaemolyticus]